MLKNKFSWVGCTICFFTLIASTFSENNACRDEDDYPVDWFVLYKLPLIADHENVLVSKGKAYAYITSGRNKGWTLSDRSITSEESIPGHTLYPLYQKNKKHLLYFMYNDKPPTREHAYSNGGHAKGVVLGDKTGGFWMIHSVPNFASLSRRYTYPRSGLWNGQSFMCITLKPEDLEIAGDLMWFNDLHIYAKSVPKSLKKMYAKLAKTAEGHNVQSSPWSLSRDIKSAGGIDFRVFAKSQNFHKELYSEWVAPSLEVSLLVQTWPNSRSHQRSTCRGPFKVENVDEAKITGVKFPSTKDHSKWAASESESQPWVCVGDINKDDSQEKRGGGTVCLQNKSVWKAYYNSVTEIESCKIK